VRLQLRPCTEADFDAILAIADAAVPFDPEGNRNWLEQRRAFDGATRVRRHYVVEEDGRLVGYGAIEQQSADSTSFRIYVVPTLFGSGVEGLLYDRLLADLCHLHARHVWVREYAHDQNVRAFFAARGFRQTALIWDLRLRLVSDEVLAGRDSPLKVRTLTQVRAGNPAELTALCELCNTLRRRAGREDVSYDGFMTWLAGEAIRPDGSFILSDGARHVGLNFLTANDRPGHLLQTFAGLLDVDNLEAAGIALLRQAMMEYALANGRATVVAYIPDEDQAWLQFNERLGFERIFGYVTMELELL
jgi:L-amino acid N-acyltransferase YncA